ncbi:MAG: hypothetical protein HY013_16290 [Candidatus Solibacter usitatus]|nr:hypothetical protein [Candidatus Solibacter usitatus]
MDKIHLVKRAPAALVGSESLMAREIRDLCATGGIELDLIAAGDDEAGRLTQQDGEPAVIGRLEADSLSGARVAFLAGSLESARAAIGFHLETALMDLTYAGEEDPRSQLRAPMAEAPSAEARNSSLSVIAHPAAIVLALLLPRLHPRHPLRRTVAHVFEPASERGRAGLDELQRQTVNLLSFKGLPKAVFDTQVAFNLLARYGEDAPESLEISSRRMERHVAALLAGRIPMPSLKLIQAPVFHGHAISLWMEFEENPGVETIERLLGSEFIDVRAAGLEPPDLVGAAGQGGVTVGAVSPDPQCPKACWAWAVCDNIRLRAENALLAAKERL